MCTAAKAVGVFEYRDMATLVTMYSRPKARFRNTDFCVTAHTADMGVSLMPCVSTVNRANRNYTRRISTLPDFATIYMYWL